MENHLTLYQSVITDIKSIISSGQEAAYNVSSKAMLLTYWNIGKRIVEQEQSGSERAEYGRGLIAAFYQFFPDEQIVNACVHNLNWTHIRDFLMELGRGFAFVARQYSMIIIDCLCQST